MSLHTVCDACGKEIPTSGNDYKAKITIERFSPPDYHMADLCTECTISIAPRINVKLGGMPIETT